MVVADQARARATQGNAEDKLIVRYNLTGLLEKVRIETDGETGVVLH